MTRGRTRKRRAIKAPDRYLTEAKRRAVRTSKLWVAGYPHLVAEWHPTKNVDLYPYEVSHGSNKPIWWKCPKGPDHEWHATANRRVPRGRSKGSRCPFCANLRLSVTNNLAARFPKIAAQWHPTKNGKRRPTNVLPAAREVAWWKCSRGADHEWHAAPAYRVSDAKAKRSAGEPRCPFCANRRVSMTNSLAARFPKIAAQWHPTKNGKRRPAKVVPKAYDVVWWKCARGPDHEWTRPVALHTAGGGRCPFCSGHRRSTTNSLAARFPALAREWHPTRNRTLRPTDVGPNDSRLVWWKCAKGAEHEWSTSVRHRTRRGTKCIFCRRDEHAVAHSLETRLPTIAKQWHPTRNGKLRPTDVFTNSRRRVWWKCPKGSDHEWCASVVHRAKHPKCPCCTGSRFSAKNSLAGKFPAVAKQWHPKKNRSLRPDQLNSSSSMRVWWKCPKGPDHEWETRVVQRTTSGAGCPFCNHTSVSVTNSLAALFPGIAADWHPKKNSMRARDMRAHTKKEVWWRCARGHEWCQAIATRTASPTRGCPICTSVAGMHPDAAREWHPTGNGAIRPTDIGAGSKLVVVWRCQRDPLHVWKQSPELRFLRTDRGCPYCAGRRGYRIAPRRARSTTSQ